MMGARRFKHFETSLGIAKNTLTARLGQLVDAEILHRVPASDGSAFDEYVLTQRGRELAPVIIALSQWGDKWVPHEDGPSTEIIDAATGTRLSQVWPRRQGGEMMPLSEVRVRRSPDAPPITWQADQD